jgi:uncharacterized protein (DUF4213/DUF364 family)
MKEPLTHLYQIQGFNPDDISKIVRGEKYVAVLLTNGRIGVCARLGNEIPGQEEKITSIDLNNTGHRILYNAYLNAKLNYQKVYDDQLDIFEVIDFKKYENLIMIGYFKPLAEKLRSEEIPFTIFDLQKTDKEISPLIKQKEFLSRADGLILTATSIFNGTFADMVGATKKGTCDIFVLGPSAILSEELLKYNNVKNIFGFVFNENGQEALAIIKAGGGTRKFNKLGDKVYI